MLSHILGSLGARVRLFHGAPVFGLGYASRIGCILVLAALAVPSPSASAQQGEPFSATSLDICIETGPDQPPYCPVSDVNRPSVDTHDEDGDLATSPLLTEEAYSAGAWKLIGDLAGPLLAYGSPGAGPLTVGAAVTRETTDSADSAAAPVSTGSCELRAGTFRGYHGERDRRGDRPYFYGSSVSAYCTETVHSAYCYTELWRSRDGAFLEQAAARDNIRKADCLAGTYHGYYERPNKHYSKAAIELTAPPGSFWGSGAGPRGWACSGQNTRYLQCRRNTSVDG